LTAWYFGLWPLQSIMLTGFGFTAPGWELAAVASVTGAVIPNAMVTLVIAAILAHRLLIAVLSWLVKHITACWWSFLTDPS
jgi:hypothetical protein